MKTSNLTTLINIYCSFQDYPKLSQTYYVLLECLAQDHMSFLSTLEPRVFLYILSSISEGLTALGVNLNFFTGTVADRTPHMTLCCYPSLVVIIQSHMGMMAVALI
jgi:hypothetical protein